MRGRSEASIDLVKEGRRGGGGGDEGCGMLVSVGLSLICIEL